MRNHLVRRSSPMIVALCIVASACAELDENELGKSEAALCNQCDPPPDDPPDDPPPPRCAVPSASTPVLPGVSIYPLNDVVRVLVTDQSVNEKSITVYTSPRNYSLWTPRATITRLNNDHCTTGDTFVFDTSGLTHQDYYDVKVRIENFAGVAAETAPITFQTLSTSPVPAPVADLRVTGRIEGTVSLQWTDGTNEMSYTLVGCRFSPYSCQQIIVPSNTTTATMNVGQAYYCFRVRTGFWYSLIESNEVCSGPEAHL